MTIHNYTNSSLAKAKLSLEGLSMGDAFGELFFSISPDTASFSDLPQGPWKWTDDTHMALSIVEILKQYGHIEQDALARAFARRFTEDPYRGYGGGAWGLLHKISQGADWRKAAPALFGGGSFGNGAAMRVAPVGGFFYHDVPRAAAEAQMSAVITHAHPEGQAGAIAVAAAAAIAANNPHPLGTEFLKEVLKFVPEGITKKGIQTSLSIPADEFSRAIKTLGTGSQVSAQDTVPFCLWNAAYHLDNFEKALWETARAKGDCDTTCAIVGGIVALSSEKIPQNWLNRRETIPSF